MLISDMDLILIGWFTQFDHYSNGIYSSSITKLVSIGFAYVENEGIKFFNSNRFDMWDIGYVV